jgi:hypothetical protein
MSTAEHTTQDAGDAPLALQRLINGFRVTQMIGVAAALGLADLVADGPKSSAELAERTGMHAPSLYRLLRALSSLGVFAEDEQQRFGLTPLAALLRSGVPGSLRDWAAFSIDPQLWRAWGELIHSVRTGETAFSHVFGMDVWSYRAQHPESGATFDAAMSSLSGGDIPAILAAYDFSAIQTLVDVGGGHGALITGILQAHPTMLGILFDQPHVLASAASVLAAAGVSDRCALADGDFFTEVPPGGDAYLLRRIIHDWDDARSVAILRNVREAMPEHGRLLLVEGVIQPPNHPDPIKIMDMNMLVMAGGLERTEGEYRALLAEAGLSLTKVYATRGPSSIIEAVPA